MIEGCSLLMNHDCLLSYDLMKVFHHAVFDSFDFFSINSKQMQISPFNFFPLQRTCTLHYSLIGLLKHAKKFQQKIENYRPPPPSSSHSLCCTDFIVHYAAAAVMKEQQKQPQC